MDHQEDPFAELMPWSKPAHLRPLPLQRSQTDSMCRRERCTSEHYPAPLVVMDGDTPTEARTDPSAPTTSAKSAVESSLPGQSSPLRYPNKYINTITPEIFDSQHSNLLIFEDESRVRTSTLESVMAVKSLNSDVPIDHMCTTAVNSIGGSPCDNNYVQNIEPLHYMEINDDKSDVSSLSEYEYHDAKSPSQLRANPISSLFKRPVKPLHPLRPNRPLRLRSEGPLAPLRPLRMRSEARSTETATTAIHTLSTIDNFDVPSPFSPLGALSGQEELSFLKSADGEEGYGSLHGYHRRCRTNAPRHVRSNSSDVRGGSIGSHTRNHSDHLTTIQKSWLEPSNRLENDLIDMEHEVAELDLIGSSSTINPYSYHTTPSSVGESAAASIGPSSVTSGASSPMKSIQGIAAMSTGDSEHSSKCTLQRPPLVARSMTSPAIFKNDNSTSTSQRINPALSTQQQRKRPPHIATGAIDSPCMIASIAIAEAVSPKAVSFPRRPSFTNHDCSSAVSVSVNTKDGHGTPSLPSLDEDNENASFGSFDEELKRKNRAKMIGREVKQMFRNLDPKPVVNKGKRLLGLKVKDHELKRADGCLT